MTEFWLVRHGQTEWNTAKRFQGRLDSPLTELGKQQALTAGAALAGQGFERAWCSSAFRAQHTARLLSEARPRPLEFHATDALTEMHFGEWEGRTRDEIVEKWGEEATPFWHSPHRWSPRGGETFAQAEARITSFLEHAASWGSPQLVVTHGMLIQLLLHAVQGWPLARLHEAPAVVQASLTRVSLHAGTPPLQWEIVVAGQILS